MAEPIYRMLETVLPAVAAVNGTRVRIDGLEQIPRSGGALVAVNHTSYLDWYPAALAAHRRGRRLRFLIKAELTEVPAVNFVIRHAQLIPVDRSAGAGAYAEAARRLRRGELVALHPEATISRSFELRPFKTGAVRLARDAGVGIIPMIVWGAQRIWTKDHPRTLWRNRVQILVRVGAPLRPADDPEQAGAELRRVMAGMLAVTQCDYPHPAGAFWVPHRLGGGAPTPAEAQRLRDAELAERARRRQRHRAAGRSR